MIPALLGLVLLPPVDVEPPSPAPKGTPPQVVNARVEGDQITSIQQVTRLVPETRTQKVLVGGKQQTRTVTVMVPVMTTVMNRWPLKGATAQYADGRKIDVADLKKKLTKPTAVLVSGDGKPVDRGFLALFNKDTVVIVAPSAAASKGRPPVPPPPPPPPPINKR